MILAHGRLYEDSTLPVLLDTLEADCIRTIASQSITVEQVIAACDTLGKRMAAGGYDRILGQFMADFQISEAHLSAALRLFSRESLQYKCRIELGDTSEPLRHEGHGDIQRHRYPLGVLFHIAAGNVDGLPAYSVIEGLLAGNINILKLPSADSGISVLLLSELCKIEPALADFLSTCSMCLLQTWVACRISPPWQMPWWCGAVTRPSPPPAAWRPATPRSFRGDIS